MEISTDTSTAAHSVPRRSPLTSWLTVLAVSAGTFSVVTTEMLPIGLLTPIGSSLEVTEGTSGLMVTVPGLVAAVSALLLPALSGRIDRRVLLCALMGLLLAGNLLAAIAPTITVILAARVLVGIAIGGYWAIAAGIAVRLVPQHAVPRATAMIFGGIAVASVLGVPAGTLVGDLATWRVAFAVVGLLCGLVLTGLALLLPELPATTRGSLGATLGLLRNPRMRTGVLTTLLLVTGHFAAYTYVRPVLEQHSGIAPSLVGVLLLVYGVAGIVGNFVAGATAARNIGRTVLTITGVLAATVLLMPVLGAGQPLAVALLVVWGLAYGGVSVSLQLWTLASVPDTPEAGSALFVAAFNLSIALGALLGGRVVDASTTSGAMLLGGTLAALALVTVGLSGGVWRTARQ